MRSAQFCAESSGRPQNCGRPVFPSILELRADTGVPERTVEAERAAGTRIALAVTQSTGQRADAIDHIRHGIEDILAADAHIDVIPDAVRQIDVSCVLGREQLAGIVILIAICAVA